MESCRAPTLLAELEDDDEMPEPDDDENDDDENEDDDDYEEVMVSRNLLSFMVHTHIISILNVNVILNRLQMNILSESTVQIYDID